MRERDSKPVIIKNHTDEPSSADLKAYFTSFYKSTIQGDPKDRHTIPGITEAESRFHYNSTENSIIRALIGLEPLPKQAQLWQLMQQRKSLHVLDIGTGVGHWIDFYLDVFFAESVTGIEIVEDMVEYLTKKYKNNQSVNIINSDISSKDLDLQHNYDLVNAIGVMFHIVDDHKWEVAMKNLTSHTKPGGLLIIGGQFGDETGNVQFHKKNDFESWHEHDSLDLESHIVNKRIRSLKDWKIMASNCGLNILDLVRSDKDDAFETPENDVLLLQKPE